METKLQTKVTPENQKEFYQKLYNADKPLIDLTQISADKYVLIDCRGQEYRLQYPDLDITVLETFLTAKQFKLSTDHFDYLIDNQIHNKIGWPKINFNAVDKCAIVFDHSPLLRYLTVSEIIESLQALSEKYCPYTILIKSSLFFIDDDRLKDRLCNLVNIQIKNYVVEKFYYDTQTTELLIQFKTKTQ